MDNMENLVTDDLTKIEGIDPAVAEVLNNAGIHSYDDLAECAPDELKELMKAAGESFSFRETGTWPEQAGLAVEGKWEELESWQEQLKGGMVAASDEEE